jgi:hypothetical protein
MLRRRAHRRSTAEGCKTWRAAEMLASRPKAFVTKVTLVTSIIAHYSGI